jgi:hypothetical protein
MKINSNEFCHLAKSEVFLVWLRNIASDLHTDLVNHLKVGKGCAANKAKMLDTLRVLVDRKLEAVLEQFLQQKFPAILIDNNSGVVAPRKVENKHRVFSYYDPSLITFPRRIIMVGNNIHKRLQDFCAKQFYCEHVIIEDYAYIEYVSNEKAEYKSSIPEKNWQIRMFKKRSNR